MQPLDRTNSWLSLVANLAILVGLIFVAVELNQNTEHLGLQLKDQSTAREIEMNLALLGDNPTLAIEESLRHPEKLTYAEFRVMDAYLISAVSVWEDRFFLSEAGLVDASDWKRKIDEEIDWYFGNRFAKNWWRESGNVVVERDIAQYITEAMQSVGDDDTYDYWLRTWPTNSPSE